MSTPEGVPGRLRLALSLLIPVVVVAAIAGTFAAFAVSESDAPGPAASC